VTTSNLLGEIFLHNLFMDCPFPCRHLQEEGTLLGKSCNFFNTKHSTFFTHYARILFHKLGTHTFYKTSTHVFSQMVFKNKLACRLVHKHGTQAYSTNYTCVLFLWGHLNFFTNSAHIQYFFHEFVTYTSLTHNTIPKLGTNICS